MCNHVGAAICILSHTRRHPTINGLPMISEQGSADTCKTDTNVSVFASAVRNSLFCQRQCQSDRLESLRNKSQLARAQSREAMQHSKMCGFSAEIKNRESITASQQNYKIATKPEDVNAGLIPTISNNDIVHGPAKPKRRHEFQEPAELSHLIPLNISQACMKYAAIRKTFLVSESTKTRTEILWPDLAGRRACSLHHTQGVERGCPHGA